MSQRQCAKLAGVVQTISLFFKDEMTAILSSANSEQ